MTLAITEPMMGVPEVESSHKDTRRYPHGIGFMDGQYLPMSEAKVSVLDWGFLHSDATYDTVHVWEGHFFRLDRFFRGMERICMTAVMAGPGLMLTASNVDYQENRKHGDKTQSYWYGAPKGVHRRNGRSKNVFE